MLIAVALVLGAVGWRSYQRPARSSQPIGLFTALPILWQPGGDLGAELNPGNKPHWAKALLAEFGTVVPLDTLDATAGPQALAGLQRLIIAQPRVLSPGENVALDNWVRGGGHLLLIIDPAYTEESPLPIGDPRRPPAQAMLSPILARWGLELKFSDEQPLEVRTADVMGVKVPAVLPGYFVMTPQASCMSWADGLAVTCAIGKGRVVALADAALLERDDPDGAGRQALSGMLDSAFAAR